MSRTARLSLAAILLGWASLVAGAPNPTPQLGPNLVANGGFEAADTPTDGWIWAAADDKKVTVTADTKVTHGGKRSLRLHSELPFKPNVYGGLAQRIGGLTPGSEYVMAVWVKGQGVGTCWFGGGPEWATRASLPTGMFDWQRVTLRWRAPDTAGEFELRLNVDSETAALWIDDVTFQEVDPLGSTPRVRALAPASATRMGYLLLAPAAQPPRLDGDLSDWPAEAVATRLPQDAGVVMIERKGDADLSATLRATAGSRSLYLGITVRDDKHWAPVESPAWTNDSLQLAFDPRHERTLGGYGPHDSEYSLMLGNDGQPHVQCWQAPQGLGDQSKAIGLAVKRVGDITTYEAAIPWQAIGVTPGTGGPLLGFDVLLNDNDGSGRRGYIELTQGIGKVKDPSFYVTALSSAASSVAVLPAKPVSYADEPVDLKAVLVLGRPLPAAAFVQLAALDAHGTATVVGTAPLAAGTGGMVQVECRLPAGRVPLSTQSMRVRVVKIGGPQLAVGTAPLTISDLKTRLATAATKTRSRIDAVTRLAEQAEAKRIATDYERLALTTAREFVGYALDDLNHDRPTRAEHVLAVLDSSLDQTAATLQSYLSGTAKPLLVPRYVTSRVEEKDGAFWADTVVPTTGVRARRPVFFVGYGHFGTVVRDLPKLPGLGANIIQIECGPSSTQPAEGVVTDQPVRDSIVTALQTAAKQNVAVIWLASPHYFPAWALAKWPELQKGGGGFFGLAVDAPQAHAIFKTHLETSLKAIGDSPALHSVCLSNEPTFTNWQNDPFRRAAFARYLGVRYGTVERLNKAWGSHYDAIVDVPLLATEGLPGEAEMTPLRYEMARFNMLQFSEYHRFMSDVVHAARPGTMTHAKVMCVPGDRQNLAWGCDPEQFAQMGDLNGNDCANMFSGFGNQYAAEWLGQNLYYDIQRSMREVPVVNSEDHIIRDREQRLIPPQHTDFALWQGAIHGRGASTIWVWERTYDRTSDFEGSILHRPENVMAVGRVGLDLQRLAPEVVKLQAAQAPVAIVYSLTAQLWSDTASGAMAKAYEALNACGVPIRFVSEQQAAAGGLKPFRAVVAPALRHAPDALVSAVTDYCRGGGSLWVVGDEPPFTRDELNRPRTASLPEAAVKTFSGKATAKELWGLFVTELRARKLEGPVTVVGSDGKAPWAVEYRAVRDPQGTLLSIVNLWGTPQKVRLVVDGRPAVALRDLRRDKALAAGELTLQPLGAMLLRVR